ncbi:MAG: heme ABC exporter ATP-binding protein CcmA [Pseudomonadota bacterium]
MTLIVDNLSVSRGGIAVLEGIGFALEPGQGLILRGPNGIGKTTLLRTLAGLQPALAGKISVADDSIAYAAHSDGIKQMLTVRENLQFWSSVFGAKRLDSALSAYQLTALMDRPAGTLSAGQKRRLGLARMLVTGRPIWIMDEPTVSLDREAVAMFAACVEAHLAAGGSAVIATHIELGLNVDVLDIGQFKARAPDGDMDALEGFL